MLQLVRCSFLPDLERAGCFTEVLDRRELDGRAGQADRLYIVADRTGFYLSGHVILLAKFR